MPAPEPSLRRAAIEAAPWLLLSAGIFAAATNAIWTARVQAVGAIDLPALADFQIVRSAASNVAAWVVAGLCAAGTASGVARRMHIPPALGLLVATVLVYFRVMNTWLEPVEGIIDTRLWSAVMWLYMPQSLAIACFAAHLAIAYRRSRA